MTQITAEQGMELDTAVAMLETVDLMVSETLGNNAKSAKIAALFAALQAEIAALIPETV